VVSLLAAPIIRGSCRHVQNNVCGSSRPGEASNRHIGREIAGRQLHFDYSANINEVQPDGDTGPVIAEGDFKPRFRMPFAVYMELKRRVL
jgi:hypothetical protein